MDELKEAWNELKTEQSKGINLELAQLKKAIHSASTGVIEKLNSRLKAKMYYTLGGIAMFIGLLFFAPNNITRVLISIVLAAYIIGGLILNNERKLIREEIDLNNNLKATIENFHFKVSRVLKYEELIGLTLYPISASAGFVIGLNIEGDIDEFFGRWQGWAILSAVLIVLAPLCHWLAKWMNRMAFGKYLDQLEKNIEELKNSGSDRN
ncbi:hypothetical protein [Fulvivirga lutimaris]|uniref:hypothetical protein n=1 Tax=Fulvivirga lutimaris TaxID=1819566 RepID=UPI0012BC1F37|nr:hypothetical protein [Fulvivirga lutimaris]MTI41454.1 hypothetical protein [Fulvivirga lutimaris]